MLYNTIHHNIRNKSGLSLIDYCLLESIYKLSTSPKARYKGWCNASKKTFEYLATTRTVTTRLKELEANGWIQFKDKSRLLKRTTDKYYSNIVAYILGVKYLHPPREETSPNNKIDNNKEIEKPSKFEFLDITPKKKYHIEDKRPDKNQPFGVVTSSQTLRAFYEDDTTELRNLLKDCFDLDATHEEISDCINSLPR